MISISNMSDIRRQCNTCGSEINLKDVRFGRNEYGCISIILCQSCRSLLHKRLHRVIQEERVTNATS